MIKSTYWLGPAWGWSGGRKGQDFNSKGVGGVEGISREVKEPVELGVLRVRYPLVGERVISERVSERAGLESWSLAFQVGEDGELKSATLSFLEVGKSRFGGAGLHCSQGDWDNSGLRSECSRFLPFQRP